MNPFKYIKAITETKEDIEDLSGYDSYLTVRALSKFQDCVFLANEMNKNYHLSKKLQFDFFINTCRKKRRWAKWSKKETNDDLEIICEYYGYGNDKAEQALRILTDDQIEELRTKRRKGGT